MSAGPPSDDGLLLALCGDGGTSLPALSRLAARVEARAAGPRPA